MRRKSFIITAARQIARWLPGTPAVAAAVLLCLSMATLAPGGEWEPVTDYPKLIRYGVLNLFVGVNQRDARVVVEMMLMRGYRSKLPGIEFELELLPDVEAAAKFIKENKMHGLSLTGIDYLRLKEEVELFPLFISSRLDTPLESYVLLAAGDMTLKKLSRMPRRRLIIENFGNPNIGLMWLDTLLWDTGYPDAAGFFTTVEQADNAARMVLPVFFGQAEACLVPESAFNTMAELNPQIGRKLSILQRSPGFVRTVNCVDKELVPPALVRNMITSAVNLKDSTDGAQLMMIFQLKRQFEYDPNYMLETEKVYRRFNEIQTAKREHENNPHRQN